MKKSFRYREGHSVISTEQGDCVPDRLNIKLLHLNFLDIQFYTGCFLLPLANR